jgi:hypothetical protein
MAPEMRWPTGDETGCSLLGKHLPVASFFLVIATAFSDLAPEGPIDKGGVAQRQRDEE